MREKKVALVTGAGTGIGQKVALALAEKGYQVYVNGRSLKKLERTLQLCKNYSEEPLLFDVSKEEEVKLAVESVDQIDYLVNNAGVNVKKAFSEIVASDWTLVLDTNIKGYFFVSKYVLEDFIQHILANDGWIASFQEIYDKIVFD